MKNIFLTTLLTLVLCTNVAIAEQQRPVKLVTLLDFRPFIWCQDGTPSGIDIDIIHELFSRIEREVSLECLPWNRAIHYTKKGNVDGLFSAYVTEERKKFATFLNVPMHTSTFSVFVRHDSTLQYSDVTSLYGLNVGMPRGYSVNPNFDAAKAAQKFEAYEFTSPEKGLELLINGRIDAYVNGRLVVLNRAKHMGIIDKISESPHPVHAPKPAFLMISQNSDLPHKQELIQALEKELKAMGKDGTTMSIINKYTQ